MTKNIGILVAMALVIGLPFIFKTPTQEGRWQEGDPILVAISPHNEAIRKEFAEAFSAWHEQSFGQPVKIDWRVIGGTSEISRYLTAEYTAAFRSWWIEQGQPWSLETAKAILDRRFDPEKNNLQDIVSAYNTFRSTDDPEAFTSGIDLFFGGGQYDHYKAYGQGITVPPWNEQERPNVLGKEIPQKVSGEIWWDKTYFGNAISTFGICYNMDRLEDLGVERPPQHWSDLANPVYFRQLGAADPTKSGSIAKAFEMLIHQQCAKSLYALGYTRDQIAELEASGGPFPDDYQQALEAGWLNGIQLVQRIGANARYFTDSASKVPIDVSMGNAAVGIAIDFYGRYQAQTSRAPDGTPRMRYITPKGGSSVSADPVSLLRGAPHRTTAVRFIEFMLSEAGQKIWNYKPGTPGGPSQFALRRLPIRKDFYPVQENDTYQEHVPLTSDDLTDPDVNPYALAEDFTYYPRWTAKHFSVHRDLIKAMCLDSADELKAAWETIIKNGGPEAHPEAMEQLGMMPDTPEPLHWKSAPAIRKNYDKIDYMRMWTGFFRANYTKVQRMVEQQNVESNP